MSTILSHVVWALCLAGVCRAGSNAPDAPSISGTMSGNWSVDVRLRVNGGRPPEALVESMEMEASAIWQQYGVALHWPSPQADASGSTLFDVLLDQHHHVETHAALGEARLAAQPGGYAAIRLDRQAVEDAMRSLTFDQLAHLGHASPGLSDVGRALGRVLAHELGHALLATRSHQTTGLMRPSFTGDELLAETPALYGLSAAEVARLRLVQGPRHEPAKVGEYHYLTCTEGNTNVRRPSRSGTVRSGLMPSCSGG